MKGSIILPVNKELYHKMISWYKEINSNWTNRRFLRFVVNYFSFLVNFIFPRGVVCTKSFSFIEKNKFSTIYGIFVFKDDEWNGSASYYNDCIMIKDNGWDNSELEETIEHEIRHAMQFLNEEGKFDKAPNRGLPKKKLQTKHADFDGILRKNDKNYNYYINLYKENPWTDDDRLPHYLRDIEFQTNLGSIWFDLKKELLTIKDDDLRYKIFYKFLNLKCSMGEYVYNSFMSIWNRGGFGGSAVTINRIKEDHNKWKDYVKKLYKLYEKEFCNKIEKDGTLTDR